jgi:hypothetical protein
MISMIVVSEPHEPTKMVSTKDIISIEEVSSRGIGVTGLITYQSGATVKLYEQQLPRFLRILKENSLNHPS